MKFLSKEFFSLISYFVIKYLQKKFVNPFNVVRIIQLFVCKLLAFLCRSR